MGKSYSPGAYEAWARFNRAAADIGRHAIVSGEPAVIGGGMVALNLGRVAVVFRDPRADEREAQS